MRSGEIWVPFFFNVMLRRILKRKFQLGWWTPSGLFVLGARGTIPITNHWTCKCDEWWWEGRCVTAGFRGLQVRTGDLFLRGHVKAVIFKKHRIPAMNFVLLLCSFPWKHCILQRFWKGLSDFRAWYIWSNDSIFNEIRRSPEVCHFLGFSLEKADAVLPLEGLEVVQVRLNGMNKPFVLSLGIRVRPSPGNDYDDLTRSGKQLLFLQTELNPPYALTKMNRR